MKSILAFCTIFLVIPVGINLIRRIFLIIYGPQSDSAYHHQMYGEMLRKAVVEIVISIIGLCAILWVFYILLPVS